MNTHDPYSPQPGGVSFADIAELACKLPGVEISTSDGPPSIKVNGRMMARMNEDGTALVLRTDLASRQLLTQSDPDAFYFTEQYRNYPLVLVRLGLVRRSALPDLLERAWRELAETPARG